MYKFQGHNLALSVQHWYVHLAQLHNSMQSDADNLLLNQTTKSIRQTVQLSRVAQSEVPRRGAC